MTPDERREFLASRGFRVARTSFRSGAGPLWSMTELNLDGTINPNQKGKHRYFIDLYSGRWERVGEAWLSWEQGPWHEQFESECEQLSEVVSPSTLPNNRRNSPQGSAEARAGETPAVVSNVILTPDFAPDGRRVERLYKPSDLQFFTDCIAAGFEIVEPGPRLLDGYKDLGNREARRNGIGYTLICSTKSIMGPGCKLLKLSDFCSSLPVQRAAPVPAAPVPRPMLSEVRVRVEAPVNTKQKGLFV